MRYFLLVLGLLLALITLILWTKTKIMVSFKDSGLKITFKILFVKYTITQEKLDKKKGASEKKDKKKAKKSKEEQGAEEKKGFVEKMLHYLELYKMGKVILRRMLGYLRYKIDIDGTSIAVSYGTGDAATTGIAYGLIFGAGSILYNILYCYFNVEYPNLDVAPDFTAKKFDIEFESIIKVRAAHIINVFFVGAFAYLKYRRENKIQ